MVHELFLLLRRPVRRIRAGCCLLAMAALSTAVPGLHASKQAKKLTVGEIDDILSRLHMAVQDYVFPETAAKLARELDAHREMYRTLMEPTSLAERLTADMRAVGLDKHLAVTWGEELGVRKNPTAEEKQHAHDFDHANAYGLRSARRLLGNIGYIDLAYFSPDPEAGTAVAAAMQVVNGTDALIVDLRRNGGGSGDTESTLASYFLADVVELSSIVESVDGKRQERQHWTVAFPQGPRYVGKPVYILTSLHTHSAAEALAYDLQNLHVATIIGEHTSGDATSGTGEVNLGHGFSAFIPNGQVVSPITHSNYFRVGVQPDISVQPEKALCTAYDLALKTAKASVASEELAKEKSGAIKNPEAALLEEINGFSQKR